MIGRTGTRILLPWLAGGLALAALTAGCSSSTSNSSASSASSASSGAKPAYCAAGQQLKTSVQDLGKANVASGGISSVQSALKNVDANAKKFGSGAKGAFPSQTTAFRNATLQGAYFIIAARALGLDTGPMSGFDAAGVNKEFFPDGKVKANFICNLGYGDPAGMRPRAPRLSFDEACKLI